ncbi:hypothetical protein OKJ48_40030 [Streptomyces kunmingensis]|uniref:Uncharacterized protein n=1 Tax=Streptomyces kunmingensis TaxID=68225 RepID=A0ABU6CNS5_9ACTN|nr:hypothetical protein [Streptomyces kunmingensis]MEB3966374.1 hypothetical protein [Streptomyces kunmingensis]
MPAYRLTGAADLGQHCGPPAEDACHAACGGLAALAEANRAATARQAEDERRYSAHRTETVRREQLFDSARFLLTRLSESLLAELAEAAPAAVHFRERDGGWTLKLGDAELHFSRAALAHPELWRLEDMPAAPFDVVAYALIQLRFSADHRGYQGRSHSLWYCDAQAEEQFRWFETAFMQNPIVGRSRPRPAREPFALPPEQDARSAISSAHLRQVAWPFTSLKADNLDPFISQWANWLAQASQRRLTYPSTMPERRPHGSWRT